MDVSIFFGSSGGGFFSDDLAGEGVCAGAVIAQRKVAAAKSEDLIIGFILLMRQAGAIDLSRPGGQPYQTFTR